jgi:O-antigen chain-terminating methyltransferase
VDLNAKMIDSSRNTSKVIVGDVIAHLKSLPDESIELITGFHIAEHLIFEDLFTLIEESLRILKPAGLLILETPNSENITVGTSGFYIDPTHIKPIPILQLSFLSEHIGFYRNQILRLQQWETFQDQATPISLYQVLSGVSPDYSIISQKNGASVNIQLFDKLFSITHGISLEEIANRQFLQQHDLYNSLRFKLLELEAINRSHDSFINTYSASIKLMYFLTYPFIKTMKALKNIVINSK